MITSTQSQITARLETAFPEPDQIPQEYRPKPSCYQGLYLIDGELGSWNGPMVEVNSPICLRKDGKLARPVIGHVPLMDEATAMRALAAANRAWNNGQGRWPTLSVSARIDAVRGS